MVEDVLDELARAELGPLVVVSGEPRALARAADAGAVTVIDEHENGQSAAALLGLARARELGCERALLVPGDCPLIDARELTRARSARAESLDVAIVPDRHGTGTNALALAVGGEFEPQFGPGSLRAPRGAGDRQGTHPRGRSGCRRWSWTSTPARTRRRCAAALDARSRTRAPRTREALGRAAA